MCVCVRACMYVVFTRVYTRRNHTPTRGCHTPQPKKKSLCDQDRGEARRVSIREMGGFSNGDGRAIRQRGEGARVYSAERETIITHDLKPGSHTHAYTRSEKRAVYICSTR